MSGSPYMTRKEAAAYARVSTKTIDRWRQHGLIGTYGNVRVVLVKRSDIDAHLAAKDYAPAA